VRHFASPDQFFINGQSRRISAATFPFIFERIVLVSWQYAGLSFKTASSGSRVSTSNCEVSPRIFACASGNWVKSSADVGPAGAVRLAEAVSTLTSLNKLSGTAVHCQTPVLIATKSPERPVPLTKGRPPNRSFTMDPKRMENIVC